MKRATIKDVAKLAGASPSSVSLLLSGKAEGRLSPALQARIRSAVDATGYRPNRIARDLATGRSMRIQVVTPGIANPYFGHLLAGMSEELGSQASLSLEVLQGERSYGPEQVRRALSPEFGVAILVAPSTETVESLAADGSFVLVDYPDSQTGWPVAGYPPDAGANELVAHLCDLGHHRIAYVGLAHSASLTLQLRRAATRSQLTRHGGSIVVEHYVEGITAVRARDTIAERLSEWYAAGVTAIICEDEEFAIGVLAACRKSDYSVPGHFSVAAFNGLFASEVYRPSLTCVLLPSTELGQVAARMALDVLQGRTVVDSELETPLLVRESTGRVQPFGR